MQNRKIKILVIICIILVITTALLNFFAMRKKPAKTNPAQTEQISETLSPAVPAGQISSRDLIYTLGKGSQVDEIKAAFKRFVSERTKNELAGAKLVDEQGNPVTFDKLSQALPFQIPAGLLKLLNTGHYDLYYCAKGTQKQLGLILYLTAPSENIPSNMPKAAEKMKSWEPAMLVDLHTLLFPNIYFSPEQLNQSLDFKDGQARFAEVVLPGGAKGSINYKFYGDPLVIASSLECLQKAEEYYLDLEDGEE